jgi:hypothetical protein
MTDMQERGRRVRWTVRAVAPDVASVVVLAVAAVAMAWRAAWPTPAELALLAISLAGVFGALRLSSERGRTVAASAWAAVLAGVALSGPVSARNTGHDFDTFWRGAALMFEAGRSPYDGYGVTAFPFPTFLLVRLVGLSASGSYDASLAVFLGLQVGLLALACWLLADVARGERGRALGPAEWLLLVGVVIHPVVWAGVNQGNSGVLAGTALIGAVWAWRRGTGRASLHAAAVCATLAWMLKPQLLLAAAFFVVTWLAGRLGRPTDDRAARVGMLLGPWAAVLVSLSVPLGFPVSVAAYADFPRVALTWHTAVAEAFVNNYAPSAVLAKALARVSGIAVASSLPLVTALAALAVVGWNVASMPARGRGSLRSFLPWPAAALLATSLVWEWYLTLALVVPAALVVIGGEGGARPRVGSALRIAAALGLTTVTSSFAYAVGLVLLYLESHAALGSTREEAAHA